MTTNPKNDSRKEIRNFLEKIVVNIGVGRASTQPNFEEKILKQISSDLAKITGQKAEIRKARKSIAGFKIREGQIVGLKVTLRRAKMVDFFERLVRIVLPRVRDFGGLEIEKIDSHGILNAGIRDQLVFPEINPEESPFSFSLGVNIVPKIKDSEKAETEFRRLGVPLKKVRVPKSKKSNKK